MHDGGTSMQKCMHDDGTTSNAAPNFHVTASSADERDGNSSHKRSYFVARDGSKPSLHDTPTLDVVPISHVFSNSTSGDGGTSMHDGGTSMQKCMHDDGTSFHNDGTNMRTSSSTATITGSTIGEGGTNQKMQQLTINDAFRRSQREMGVTSNATPNKKKQLTLDECFKGS